MGERLYCKGGCAECEEGKKEGEVELSHLLHVDFTNSRQTLSQSLNQTEEAKQLLVTAKTMLEALLHTTDLMKDTQLSDSELSPSHSMETTPSANELQGSRGGSVDAVEVRECCILALKK